MGAYPASVSTFTVVGRLHIDEGDGIDVGADPDVNPQEGVSVTFTPQLSPKRIRVPGFGLVDIAPVAAVTDADGYVKTIGGEDVVLAYGGDPDITPTGWTWLVSIEATSVVPEDEFSIAGSAGGTVDLSEFASVSPADPGAEVVAWVSARDAAIAAKDDAEAAQAAAETAQAAAEAAQAAAEAVPTSNDGIVAGLVADSGSSTRGQLDAAIAEGVDPVAADAAMKLGVFYLNRRDLDSMSGSPVEAMLNNGSTYVPVWQFPDGSASSVGGVVTGLPASCVGVKVEAILAAVSDASGSNGTIRIVGSSLTPGSVFGAGQWLDKPVVASLPVASSTKQQILEAFLPVDDPTLPLAIRVTREGTDQWDSWGSTINLVAVKVTPLTAPPAPVEVQEADGQNTWPFLLSVGSKLICFYSEGVQHGQPDTTRKAVARASTDGGATWGAQYTVLDRAGEDDSVVGCGVDASGDPLLWIRSDGTHRLYRSTDDGATFAYVATPTLSVTPKQLGPIMNIPTVGLVSFWNGDTPNRAWGIVKSSDDGATWTQVTVESNLAVKDTPTEIAGVYLGSGKILAIGRNELGDSTTDDAFLQLTSSNYGSTWSRNRSNILDTYKSTPAMIYDSAADLVHLYYYRRLWGQVRHRAVDPDTIWSSPRKWPEATIVAHGWSRSNQDAGNVHAALHGDAHKVAFYSGDETDTSIQVSTVEV